MSGATIDTVIAEAEAWLQANSDEMAALSDALFWFGEPSLQEHETAALLVHTLEAAGFAVERGISGFPTAFCARYGAGKPVVALHAEYDGCPDNSQMPGVTHQQPIIEGAPGHCEGHNGNATVMIGAALAARRAMERHGIEGEIRVIGAPAEELTLTRPYFVRDGYFDDVDVAFHNHIGDRLGTEYGLVQIAAMSAEFRFRGATAHAGLEPWVGRDALDAVTLMDMGMAQLREHLKPEMRMHRVILHGGEQPNVIPARAAVWWMLRGPDAEDVRQLFERTCRVARGAAMMTDTEEEVEIRSAVWPVRCNQTLAELIARHIERIGMPEWTTEEDDFAKELQSSIGSPAAGLRKQAERLQGPMPAPIAASNDCGDVSWKTPMGRLWWPGTVPGTRFHHWSGGAALTTSIAHKGEMIGARILAACVIEALAEENIVRHARETFKKELGERQYAPLIPEGQQPKTDVHSATMEHYRPLMQKHYPTKRPKFRL